MKTLSYLLVALSVFVSIAGAGFVSFEFVGFLYNRDGLIALGMAMYWGPITAAAIFLLSLVPMGIVSAFSGARQAIRASLLAGFSLFLVVAECLTMLFLPSRGGC